MPPQAGHGSLIAIELDPAGAAGVFTTVAQLNGDITWPELGRPASQVTPHQDDIDSYVFGVLTVGTIGFSVNFIYDNTTHDYESGLYSKIINKEDFGMRLRGPSGSSGVDEWIMSGQITAITQTAPVREGARTCDVTFQSSGTIIIEGDSIGSVGG